MQTNQTKQFKSSKIRTSFKIGKQEVLEWWQAKKIYLKKKIMQASAGPTLVFKLGCTSF